jgi:hypothetical protein
MDTEETTDRLRIYIPAWNTVIRIKSEKNLDHEIQWKYFNISS